MRLLRTDAWPTFPLVLVMTLVLFAERASGQTGSEDPRHLETDVAASPVSTPPDHGLPDAVRAGDAVLPAFATDGEHDPSIPSPAQILGFPLSSRPVRHQEMILYLEALAEVTPRVRLIPYGTSHEGRALLVAAVTSESNMERLGEIKKALARFADPQAGNPPPLDNLPVCIWAGCCIHGDETSSTDAALFVAYHLAASEDPAVADMRNRLLILLDPLQNPDGRERILSQWQSFQGRVPDGDDQSLRHQGSWPGGRTNHYLFDLNRDWFLVTQPETEARVRFVTAWNPQLVIDAHEMGTQATYLFSPPREPFNPSITEFNHYWWRIFSQDQAAAFDRHGWEYYTAEWNEEWFPGYGSAWAAGIGAVGILYEQGGVEGSRIARLDGTVMTYHETVHHQITSFLSNFRTAAEHREELLRSYREKREQDLSEAEGAFVFLTRAQPERETALLRALHASGVKVYRNPRDVKLSGLTSYWSDKRNTSAVLPAGTLVVPIRQPHGPMAETMFAFDPRMDAEFLRSERRRLEKERRSRIYEVTAWSVALSCGLPVYYTRQVPWKDLEEEGDLPVPKGCLVNPNASFGFLIDGTDDRCLNALVRLWAADCKVHAAQKPFVIEGKPFVRGTLLVKRVLQNQLRPGIAGRERDPLAELLVDVSNETGVVIVGIGTALSDDGPDLGSQQFRQLEPSKVAVLAGEGISAASYGGILWVLDHEVGLPTSVLAADAVSRFDLDRYNVLILPDAWGGPGQYKSSLDTGGIRKIQAWLKNGGTLIGVASGAAFAADSTNNLGTVRLRRQVLGDLAKRSGWKLSSRDAETDGVSVERNPSDISPNDFRREELNWAKAPGAMDGLLEEGLTALRRPEPFWKWAVGKTPEELEREDKRMRLYHPRGAILKVDLDEEHWLASGCGVFTAPPPVSSCSNESPDGGNSPLPLCDEGFGSWMPVQAHGEYAFVATDPADVVGAYAPEDSLRLGGLLWPEARERWTRTAYLTRERHAEGQVILFAAPPCRRGAFRAAQRAFLNAVLLGPGMGSARDWPWE